MDHKYNSFEISQSSSRMFNQSFKNMSDDIMVDDNDERLPIIDFHQPNINKFNEDNKIFNFHQPSINNNSSNSSNSTNNSSGNTQVLLSLLPNPYLPSPVHFERTSSFNNRSDGIENTVFLTHYQAQLNGNRYNDSIPFASSSSTDRTIIPLQSHESDTVFVPTTVNVIGNIKSKSSFQSTNQDNNVPLSSTSATTTRSSSSLSIAIPSNSSNIATRPSTISSLSQSPSSSQTHTNVDSQQQLRARQPNQNNTSIFPSSSNSSVQYQQQQSQAQQQQQQQQQYHISNDNLLQLQLQLQFEAQKREFLERLAEQRLMAEQITKGIGQTASFTPSTSPTGSDKAVNTRGNQSHQKIGSILPSPLSSSQLHTSISLAQPRLSMQLNSLFNDNDLLVHTMNSNVPSQFLLVETPKKPESFDDSKGKRKRESFNETKASPTESRESKMKEEDNNSTGIKLSITTHKKSRKLSHASNDNNINMHSNLSSPNGDMMEQSNRDIIPSLATASTGSLAIPFEVSSLASDTQLPRFWTPEEDKALAEAIKIHGAKRWKLIASHVPGRNPTQCQQRWSKVLVPGLRKGPWSTEEDALLLKLTKEQTKPISSKSSNDGKDNDNSSAPTTPCENKNKSPEPSMKGLRINWKLISESIPGRTAKQCRARWVNNLNPDLKKDKWTSSEDETILKLYKNVGSKWSYIASHLEGRSENAVKIRFISLSRMGKGIIIGEIKQ